MLRGAAGGFDGSLITRNLLLDRLHFLDRRAQLRNQVPDHAVLQPQAAHIARNADRQAPQFPAQPAILFRFSLARHRHQPLPQLHKAPPQTFQFEAGSQHLPRAGLVSLVGRDGIVELKHVARRHYPGTDLLAQPYDRLYDDGAARQRAAGFQLAAFDAPRDLNLALPIEQWHRPHLAEIKPHWIVGLIEALDLGKVVALFEAAVVLFVVERGHIGAGTVERKLFQIRCDQVLRDELDDIVEQHKAAFLAHDGKGINSLKFVFGH